MTEPIDLVPVCALCQKDMRVESAPAPDSTCSHNCPMTPHAHTWCERCSIPGWFAILMIRTEVQA